MHAFVVYEIEIMTDIVPLCPQFMNDSETHINNNMFNNKYTISNTRPWTLFADKNLVANYTHSHPSFELTWSTWHKKKWLCTDQY